MSSVEDRVRSTPPPARSTLQRQRPRVIAAVGLLALLAGVGVFVGARTSTASPGSRAAVGPVNGVGYEDTSAPSGVYGFVSGGDNGTTATVDWDAPRGDAASVPTGWVLRRDGGTPSQDAGATVPALPSSSSAYTFTGLHPDTTYLLFVRPVSPRGAGAENSASVHTAAVPGTPAGLEVHPHKASATVTWPLAQPNGGTVISGWRLTRTGPGVATTVDLPAAQTSTAVEDLLAGGNYAFALSAVNAVGEGASTSASARIPTIPGSPQVTQVAAGGSLTANVMWTAPADTGGGIGIYVVRAFRVAGGRTVETFAHSALIAPPAMSNTFVLDAPGVWRFNVQAANDAGSSHASAFSQDVTVF